MMVMNRAGKLLAVAAVLAFVGTGCPKKTPGPGEADSGTGLEEQAFGGPARSTLADEQEGIPVERRASGPLKDVHFGFDSFALTDAARKTLQENGTWLIENGGMRVELEGHCDERGTVEYNLALGAKRASAAKTYLISLGVAGERITTISYGEELPLCTDKTEACWQRNRRAHFVIMGE
jgi:peptidoglycan-associated lipoprotein